MSEMDDKMKRLMLSVLVALKFFLSTKAATETGHGAGD